ncbi:hypothetical protein [uncultured Litoreibacter sp.]|uniref:hypothetical protein n=1 Tax=uncultured Litoreibacter sp. TaxID=1392394 RepID=UPI0026291444|nr:hypothetical protein [uncultured Litoreibacter sp.]
MRILKLIRILGTALMLGAFVVLGHSYHTTMIAPAGAAPGPKFVSDSGRDISRPGIGEPSFLDSAKLFWANFTGKEEKPKNGLKDLHNRTALSRAPAPHSVEAATREIEFWANITSKMGLEGP